LGVTAPAGSWGLAYVAVGDFNNDTNPDLVTAGYNMWFAPAHPVYLGNGQGGFTNFHNGWIPGGGEMVSVDLNNDGNLDVAMANGYMMMGYGNGSFYIPYLEDGLVGAGVAAAGDFTGDGNADLVAVGDSVAVLRGDGNEGFLPPIHHSANGTVHTDVATADFNSDGKLDAVVANGDTGTVSMMLGIGNGTLSFAGAFATGTSPSSLTVGDFNGDGQPDVAVANAGSNTVSVLLNDGDWPDVSAPRLIINNVTVTEGNTGTANAVFTVTLSAASGQPVTVNFTTANSTATAASDYQAATGELIFAPGETTKTITVPVIGDRLAEPKQTYLVNLSNPTNASIADGQGVGTITDDEPRISISDVTRSEGRRNKTTLFTFTVTLSAAYDQPVTMSFATVNGTATTSDNDYIAKTGTLTFAPGETSKTITIEVKGDSKKEAAETFYLDLFGNSSNSLVTKSRGVGTILNDD
jgi:hypothetical protein